ncbi:SAP domain-containing protein [Nakamurella sp. GG22]
MTISTDSYTAAAGQARQATEKSVDVFKNVTQRFTDQFDVAQLPAVDLTQPVTRYFEFLQKAVDVNRELATQWVELVSNFSGSVREQAQQIGTVVNEQADTVADLTTRQAEQAERAAKEQVEQARREQAEEAEEAEKAKAREAKRVEREEARRAQQQAEEAEEAEKAKAREAKRVEREEARKAREQAREAYEGLSKAELSDKLAQRGLPKTGNIEDLIERLVSADSE